MTEPPAATLNPRIAPLPYHEAVRDYLRDNEPDIWGWYASHRAQTEHVEAVRFNLLKTAYRVEKASREDWYAASGAAAESLGLNVPITIYQAQNPAAGLNAELAFLPHEAHVVLHGPVANTLTMDEQRALFGHELSHLLLWQGWNGDFLRVDQILHDLTRDARAETAHFATARLFRLYNEIFCDRGALLAVKDPLIVIRMLVKITTGLDDVDAASYIRQAEEIMNQETDKSREQTHPEIYRRVSAIQRWAADDPHVNRHVAEMLEGSPELKELDLLSRARVSELTRRLIGQVLAWPFWRSELALAHARSFFEEPFPADSPPDESLAVDLATRDPELLDYFCFVLLDFVTVDRELEELPLAAALTIAEPLGIKDRLMELAKRELRMRKSQVDKIDEEKQQLLARKT